MATLMLPSPIRPVPSPVDPLVALHDRSVRSYGSQILHAVADCETGLSRLDVVLDTLPDTLEAVRANPLSHDAGVQLHTYVEQLLVIATRFKDAARHINQLSEYGRRQLVLFENRLAEVRLLSEEHPPADESTCHHDVEDAA